MFGRKKPQEYCVVEIEKPRQLAPLDEDISRSVASLQSHPGFLYLLNKLKTQRALLMSTLGTKRQANLTDVEFLQSGIVWCSWLEDQLNRAISFKARSTPQPALDLEEQAFREAEAMIESVGG